jgi:5'-deoxynucleotidase YfbR-like HD superfamily hydrolase
MGLDEDSIVAALLHDVIEDTPASHEAVAKRFGVTVADLVEGVTKLTRVQLVSKEEAQMESLRKMLMAMSKDIRVILIKIADRLCAYIKCLTEEAGGNRDFLSARRSIEQDLDRIDSDELRYFREHLLGAFSLTIDDM